MKNAFYSEGSNVFIELNDGHVAVIDKEDLPLVDAYPNTWSVQQQSRTRNKYAIMCVNNTTHYMHRVITDQAVGDKTSVDHLDHDGLNNCRDNLRVVDQSRNTVRKRMFSRRQPLPRNIVRRKDSFAVSIQYNGQRFYMQSKSLEECLAMRDVVRCFWQMPPAYQLEHPYEATPIE